MFPHEVHIPIQRKEGWYIAPCEMVYSRMNLRALKISQGPRYSDILGKDPHLQSHFCDQSSRILWMKIFYLNHAKLMIHGVISGTFTGIFTFHKSQQLDDTWSLACYFRNKVTVNTNRRGYLLTHVQSTNVYCRSTIYI